MRKTVYALYTSVIGLLLLPLAALAGVNATESITLVLPEDGSQYTLNSGGSFDTLTVNSKTFVFDISAGGSVELISGDKKKLTNDMSPAVSTDCRTSDSRIFLSVPTGGSTKTVTVTPGDTCSSSTSSGGGGNPSLGSTAGGGGGGGSTSPSTAPAPAPAPKPAPISAPVPTPTPQPSVSPAAWAVNAVFVKDLALGQVNNDVRRLQALLAGDKSIYPEGYVTGKFGPLTVAAVKRFQKKYGISAIGIVGSQTRKKLAEVFGKASEVTPAPAPTPAPVPTPASISGNNAALIKQLQKQIQILQVKLLQLKIQAMQDKIKVAK